MQETNYFFNKNYLYQFGNGLTDYIVFPQTEFESEFKLSLKSQYEDSNFIDGSIRTNGNDRNYLSSAEIPVSTVLKDTNQNIDLVKKTLFKPPQKAFFFNIDQDGLPTVYFNPLVDIVSPYSPKTQSNETYGQKNIVLDTQLKLLTPFIYKCKNNLSYFDEEAYVSNLYNYTAGNVITYNGSINYDEAITASGVQISSLTLRQKQDIFLSCSSNKPLVYTDKFFDLKEFSVTNDQLVINTTLTTNNVTQVETTDIYKDTTADNHIYIIEIAGSLAQGESLYIENISNESSLKITWESGNPSPSIMYYNSYWDRLYNASGVEINPLAYSKDQPTKNFLYFSPLLAANKSLQKTKEVIKLQKSTTNNITIKLENLNTYNI